MASGRGQAQARSEEAKRLEKKLEDLKKRIQEETRKEAEKTVLEGGSDGLDEEAEAEKEEERKDMEKLRRMMEKMGVQVPWGMGGGPMRAGGNGGKIILEERHFRRMEKYDGGEGKWEKWWFDLTTVGGGVDQELERVLGEVTDPMKNVETKREFDEVVGEEVLRKYSGELFTVLSSLTSGEASTEYGGEGGGDKGKWEVWI